MKQTAVEWLFNRLTMDLNIHQKAEAFEQAKQMEKEQIINTFIDSRILSVTNNISNGEHYYNETFKLE